MLQSSEVQDNTNVTYNVPLELRCLESNLSYGSVASILFLKEAGREIILFKDRANMLLTMSMCVSFTIERNKIFLSYANHSIDTFVLLRTESTGGPELPLEKKIPFCVVLPRRN